MPATSSGPATLPRAEIALRRTFASSPPTSSRSAGTAAEARRLSRISMSKALRPRSSVRFMLSIRAWSTPSAKTVSRLRLATSAGSPPSWIARTRSGTVEPSPTPPSAASAAAFTGFSVLAAAVTTAGNAERSRRAPRAPSRATCAVGGRLVSPSASCLTPLLSTAGHEPHGHGGIGRLAACQDLEDLARHGVAGRLEQALQPRQSGGLIGVVKELGDGLRPGRVALSKQPLAAFREGVAGLEPDRDLGST